MTIEIPGSVRESILEHAREGAPEEIVGVLAGDHGEPSIVDAVYRAQNAADTPETRYEIAPAEEIELLETVDDDGFDVVGFYHSHPRGPLEPSDVDARLAAWPGYSYVIVSLADGEAVESWRWDGKRFEGEVVRSS